MKAQQVYRPLHQQLSYRLEHNVSIGIKRFFENGNVWILADTIWYEGFREVPAIHKYFDAISVRLIYGPVYTSHNRRI